MDHGDADLSVVIRAESGSFFEYLPDPIILFPKARLTSKVLIELDPQATVLMSDSFLIHDPNDSGDVFSEFKNEIEVKQLDGKLLCRDRNSLTGTMYTSEMLGVMGPNRVHGTFFLLRQNLPIESICTEFREEAEKQLDRVCNTTHHVEGEAEHGHYTGQCRPGPEPVECTPRQERTCAGTDGARAVETGYEGSRPPRLLNDGVDE